MHKYQFSLVKLMVLHDLPCSMVTNKIAFDQQDLHSTPEFEHAMERRCQPLVSKLETSHDAGMQIMKLKPWRTGDS